MKDTKEIIKVCAIKGTNTHGYIFHIILMMVIHYGGIRDYLIMTWTIYDYNPLSILYHQYFIMTRYARYWH